MKSPDKETVSRLMDGEWDAEVNPAECLAELCACDESRARWARYHLARDILRDESVERSFSVADQVRAAIAEEETYSNVASLDNVAAPVGRKAQARLQQQQGVSAASQGAVPAKPMPWRQGAAGFALAASVAAASVVGLNVLQQESLPDSAVASADSGNIETATPVVNAGGSLDSENVTAVADASRSVTPGQALAGLQLGAGGQVAARRALLPQVDFVSNSSGVWMSDRTGAPVDASVDSQLSRFFAQHIESAPGTQALGTLLYPRFYGVQPQAGVLRTQGASDGQFTEGFQERQ